MNKHLRTHLFATTAFLLAGLAATSATAAVETYKIDPVHSSIAFKIRHLVSRLPGAFTQFEGLITVDRDNLEKSSISATIDIGSVNTANTKRDEHLKAADFFDAANHPKATFTSTSWKKTGDNTYDVTGNLTIRGVTKPVVLQTELLAFGPGPGGAQLSGWQASTTVNKKDFGINGPTGLGSMLGDEVAIVINIEAGLQN